MSRVRIMVAQSLDGFVATPDGGVAWLDAFSAQDVGFSDFMAGVGAVVMGRATYEQAASFDGPWPYAGKRVVVLTSRPLETRHPVDVRAGDVREVAADLRATTAGDVWLCGGPRVFRRFLDAGLVDTLEVAVIPVLLGAGVPLVEPAASLLPLRLERTRSWPNGVVSLDYAVLRSSSSR
jgi:dihydrofolate reductase